MSDDFWSGFFIGIAAAAIVGLLSKLAGPYVRNIRSSFRPQVITHTTKKTPCRVVMESILSFLLIVAVTMLLLYGGYLLMIYYGIITP